MTETGFRWSIAAVKDAWTWRLLNRDRGQTLVAGDAPSRAVAAALVVRAIARSMTVSEDRSLAA